MISSRGVRLFPVPKYDSRLNDTYDPLLSTDGTDENATLRTSASRKQETPDVYYSTTVYQRLDTNVVLRIPEIFCWTDGG